MEGAAVNICPILDADRELERKIQTAAVRVALARTHEEHRPAWNELVRLIRMRSPEQVRKMEQERGLR